jgi:hypothetical protein
MVTGCTNCSKKTKGMPVSYHRLPQDKRMRKIWLNRVRRDNPPEYKSCYVCSMHFTSDCFDKHVSDESDNDYDEEDDLSIEEDENDRLCVSRIR